MGLIRIHNQGFLTTVQDLGRYGFQQFGMPVAGAMDSHSLQLANFLVGNDIGEACLEATFLGPEIEFLSNALIAVCGGDTTMKLNDAEVEMNTSIRIEKGDALSFGMMKTGCRLYIAFSGGIDVPIVMGSKSTYLRAKIGGFNGRSLFVGDELKIGNPPNNPQFRSLNSSNLLNIKSKQNIRFIVGSEVSRFTFEGISTFLKSEYTITPKSDRMGYRLSGPKIEHSNGADIISSGISSGAVQVPGHGEPIIMLSDHQTVGGYTKIANIISLDLPLLGQMKAGDSIRFTEVRLPEAQKLLIEHQQKMNALFKG